MKYNVVDAQKVANGWLVTFGYRTTVSWWQRLTGKRPVRRSIVAFTEGNTDWRYFPSLAETTFQDWEDFNDAWERHEILEGMSEGDGRP